MIFGTKEAQKINCSIKLKQILNLLERQESGMGTAGNQSPNPDSAIYKLNRQWVNFVTSLKLSLLICKDGIFWMASLMSWTDTWANSRR